MRGIGLPLVGFHTKVVCVYDQHLAHMTYVRVYYI